MPEIYHYLLDWYQEEFCGIAGGGEIDPVLAMVGVGKEIWQEEGGDAFINRLRKDWIDEGGAATPSGVNAKAGPDTDRVWARIFAHQGELFRTTRRLPLTYKVEGNGIWFFRDGRRINRKLSRTQVDIAIARCPLENTAVIKDLFDYPFLFAVLMDERIRQNDW